MKIAIFGAGGHGKVAADIAISNGYKEILFFDDNIKKNQINNIGRYCGNINKALGLDLKIPIFVAIGENLIREKIYEKFKNKSKTFVSLIHPSAVVSHYAKIGKGVIVMPNAVINAHSKISKGNIINTSSSIDHDCSISKFCHICPGVNIAGNVKIGQFSFIGVGSKVSNNLKIGKNVYVTGGSFVYNNIPPNQKYKFISIV